MNEGAFDRIVKVSATSASRRGVVAGLSRGLVGALSLALVGTISAADADAKAHKGKKLRRRKHKKQPAGAAGTPTGPGSPQTPATGPGFCSFVNSGSFEFTKGRMAQTFLPPKAGKLTEATIYLVDNPSMSLQFEIRKVNAAGAPTNTVLAEQFVLGIQPTNINDPAQAVTATFATPPTLTPGQPYALSVRATNQLYFVATGGGPGDGCTDGTMFRDEFAIGDFVEFAEGTDMAYTLTVV